LLLSWLLREFKVSGELLKIINLFVSTLTFLFPQARARERLSSHFPSIYECWSRW
jgi:hypothetical protein